MYVNEMDNFSINTSVIVRTYYSGIWYGKLIKKEGKEVILANARMMWEFWNKRSISIPGVVCYGIDQSKSKICAAVPKVWLEAIEIIPISGDAEKSIKDAPIVEAEIYELRQNGAGTGNGAGSYNGVVFAHTKSTPD